ncbi:MULTISPECIES: hypothetical protein [unclassified Burkholderia]|nr:MULTISPECIES: hypothetical protein [unclassified Burkholderia]SFW90625.1 hypothetical protein SAMN03159384_07061 [Burkholderia sp. NFACC33-1]SFY46511.1 hypothetical protein SAMN03159408_07050 [Burkholderia sp. NFPP32]
MSKKRPTPAAMETLVRYAQLTEADQDFFHSAINDYVLASASRQRKLVEQWASGNTVERARHLSEED